MPDPSTEEFCKAVQEAALPGVWSKGVAASRNLSAVRLLTRRGSEWKVRVMAGERVAQPTVTLWIEDGDWHCDCGDRADPCPHVVTAALAAKAGRIIEGEVQAGSAETAQGTALPPGTVLYEFRVEGSDLRVDRFIQRAGVEKEPLRSTLVSYAGGLQTGRESKPVAASKEDFAIDHALSGAPRTGLPGVEGMHFILGKLAGTPGVRLEGREVEVHPRPRPLLLKVEDAQDGIRVFKREDPQFPGERKGFSNGALLIGNHLFPAEAQRWTELERRCLTTEGTVFRARELAAFVEEVLPALRRKCEVEVSASRLPETAELPLDAVIELDTHRDLGEGALAAVARLIYGDNVAEVENGELKLLKPGVLPTRDREADLKLGRRLFDELHLRVGQPLILRGDEAVRFRGKLQLWTVRTRAAGGDAAFAVRAPLTPRVVQAELQLGASPPAPPPQTAISLAVPGLHLEFTTDGGITLPAAKVFEAWRNGQSFLALGDGQGWAPLPRDWLERFGSQLEKLFLARTHRPDAAPKALEQLRVAGLLEEAGLPLPEIYGRLRTALTHPEASEEKPRMREGLRADLRPYQLTGIRWLGQIERAGLGGILADDMGLGKTLQAMAASRGRTLVVCPASVLVAWKEQLTRFLPTARVSLYAGAKRRLEPGADFTLCTYGILRQDAGVLTPTEWDTVILDEAQTIKNRDSQVAQAAFEIKGRFRIALSGTPIENSVQDLVSILQFACPGAVTRDDAQDLEATQLKKRVRPLILRRLKQDVATDLPPRTESVLRCVLSTPEREAYDALAHSTHSEVAKWMQERTGQAAIQALESILRLRQACNHLALVPGQTAATSAKLELLLEQLETAHANGHRALVFSQWTSFLDLIEPALAARGLRSLRLDGSTRDRESVVREFQSPSGPPVLLLSLKAGGTGLTLTAADYVYIVDPWWNPAVEAQAADRAHRIGQDKSVFVYRLVAEGTIEEKILALQDQKRQLVSDVLGENGGRMEALEPAEILGLLS